MDQKKIYAVILVLSTIEFVFSINLLISTKYADGEEVLDELSKQQNDWICKDSITGDVIIVVNTSPKNKVPIYKPPVQPNFPFWQQYYTQESTNTNPNYPTGFSTESSSVPYQYENDPNPKKEEKNQAHITGEGLIDFRLGKR